MKDLFVKKKQEVEATKAYRGNFRLDKLRPNRCDRQNRCYVPKIFYHRGDT